MTRFDKDIGKQPLSGGTEAIISFDEYNNVANTTQTSVSVIERSRRAIAMTIAVLNEERAFPDRVEYAFDQFFRINNKNYQSVLRPRVAAKLVLIQNGISGNVRLKIGDLQDAEGVQFSGGLVRSKEYRKNNKWYHSSPLDGGPIYGAIHMSRNSITIRTFVHEASHKFFGAEDYFYLTGVQVPNGRSVFNVIPVEGYDASDDLQSYDNADSYAWLVTYFASVFEI
jgi:hypothetical protein